MAESKPRISVRIQSARDELDRIQSLISTGNEDQCLILEEKYARDALNSRILEEESMPKQKAREKHLNLGNGNSKYFYSYD